MIAFIVALKKEAQPLLDCFTKLKQDSLCGKPLYSGELEGKPAVLIINDIGKVSASLGTQAVIDKYSPELVVNFGTCGGIKGTVEREFYCVTESCQYDLDLSDIDDVAVGYNQGYDKTFFPSVKFDCSLKKAKLATSDRFTCKESDIETIKKLGASLFDMEGGAIAQTCYSCNVPFLCIKGVSDVFGSGNNAEKYYENVVSLMQKLPSVISKVLTEYGIK